MQMNHFLCEVWGRCRDAHGERPWQITTGLSNLQTIFVWKPCIVFFPSDGDDGFLFSWGRKIKSLQNSIISCTRCWIFFLIKWRDIFIIIIFWRTISVSDQIYDFSEIDMLIEDNNNLFKLLTECTSAVWSSAAWWLPLAVPWLSVLPYAPYYYLLSQDYCIKKKKKTHTFVGNGYWDVHYWYRKWMCNIKMANRYCNIHFQYGEWILQQQCDIGFLWDPQQI